MSGCADMENQVSFRDAHSWPIGQTRLLTRILLRRSDHVCRCLLDSSLEAGSEPRY